MASCVPIVTTRKSVQSHARLWPCRTGPVVFGHQASRLTRLPRVLALAVRRSFHGCAILHDRIGLKLAALLQLDEVQAVIAGLIGDAEFGFPRKQDRRVPDLHHLVVQHLFDKAEADKSGYVLDLDVYSHEVERFGVYPHSSFIGHEALVGAVLNEELTFLERHFEIEPDRLMAVLLTGARILKLGDVRREDNLDDRAEYAIPIVPLGTTRSMIFSSK